MTTGNDGARADVGLTEAERETLGLIVARYDHEDQSLTEWHHCATCKGGPCACSGRPWLGDEMAGAIENLLAERLRQVDAERDRAQDVARKDEAEKGRMWQHLRDRCAAAEAALAEARQREERVRALASNWLRLAATAMDAEVREWTKAAATSVLTALDGGDDA